MEQILINLVAGAIGGGAAGKASPTFDMGTVGNLIVGAVGGGVLGQIVTLMWPAISASMASGDFSIGSVITNLITGGAGGAILTAIVGMIKNKAAAEAARGRASRGRPDMVRLVLATLDEQAALRQERDRPAPGRGRRW